MQSSAAAQPKVILQWLHKEMGYRSLGPYSAASSKSQLPSIHLLRKIFFLIGFTEEDLPWEYDTIWNFLITHLGLVFLNF
ncbi:hypothetical protein ACFX16_024177 [Malus domestica]